MPSESTAFHELVFAAEGIEPGILRVTGVSCAESMSRPYVVDVDLESPVADFDPRPLVLRSAAVLVGELPGGAVLRRYAGVVTRVRVSAGHVDERSRFSLTLEPPLAILRFTTDHRIFQQKTTRQIVEALLDEAGIDASTVSFRLSGAYPTREVCTQLGEDNLAFLSRLLEEEGIHYFFEHGDDGPKLVLGDSASAYAAVAPSDELPFRTAGGLASRQAILSMSEHERLRPAKVTLRDHDFRRPALDLEARAQGEAPLGREHYDYPGRYVDPAEGRRRARLRIDAMDVEASRVRGESTAFSLSPGHTFTVRDAPDASLERAWAAVEVTHRWATDGAVVSFSNTFEAIASDVVFRPPMVTPRAQARGVHAARVTGPKGEEIHCDELGRIKAHFPWDRRSAGDEKSSSWIRVGQLHTSGSVAIPRVGWEVLVEFEDGDPDRPIVIGRVYDGAHPPPYALPKGKTISALKSSSSPGGGGHNEIRMEDGGGGEHVHVHAQKDLNLHVANNKTEKVATHALHSVGANQTISVGADDKLTVGDQRELKVGASQTWSVGGSRTKTVGGGE
jgi:type VI secretion system secreted protein VgrG